MLLLPETPAPLLLSDNEIEGVKNKLMLGKSYYLFTHLADRPSLAKNTLWFRRRSEMFGTTALSFYDRRSTKSHSVAPTCDLAPQA
jgi:hypothetical protein